MRYYTDTSSLFIRGGFRAASTGLAGGIRSVPALVSHSLPAGEGQPDPGRALETVVAAQGLEHSYFGLTTTVPVHQACVLQHDFITVFIAAGIRREPPATGGSITIIVVSSQGMDDAALLEAIMVASEAKAEALQAMDLPLSGTPADAVIVACENEGAAVHVSAGRSTEAGMRIRNAVLYGIPQAIGRHDAGVQDDRPAFFVFSRIREDHWIHWTKDKCPYYPCHFAGQSCEYCYCPFYHCHDETLGQWAAGSNGKKVWNCATCRLLHEPEVAAYLKAYPGASRQELMRLAGRKNQ
ncbi:MAG: hypothetical protein GYA23_02095 [Methanomicrobiales archaeon]|nr:hypothetical protein [Methanomicrobiales archaeon]